MSLLLIKTDFLFSEIVLWMKWFSHAKVQKVNSKETVYKKEIL
jgi:hypothetical protein